MRLRRKKRVTTEQLRRAFLELTGDELELKPFDEELAGIIPRVDHLSFDRVEVGPDGAPEVKPISAALREKYGEFVIAVYEANVPEGKDIPEQVIDGTRWLSLLSELGPRPGPYVAAVKTYGRNVELRWYPESRRRESNHQWQSLDTALTEIVG